MTCGDRLAGTRADETDQTAQPSAPKFADQLIVSIVPLAKNLDNKKNATTLWTMDQDTMDLDAVAVFLHAEPATVAQCARTGELPGTRIGKGWVFLREDVLAFLRQRIAADTAERRAKQNPPSLGSVSKIATSPARRQRRAVIPELPGAATPTPAAHAVRGELAS
jgi:hypothetical protein